ncbi:MAG: FAD-binding oxidoreductase [Acidimicrobiia bacterium]|nr:FAD-binding oxidoreductase [Acidimicrobiia bacterium]MDH5503302.1 FAD-binding oxidoreductase [Acidimicrobiia bacterium]
MSDFTALPVTRIEHLTDDSVAITFGLDEKTRPRFRYSAGQHVTVRAFIDGNDIRRSYSICSDASIGELRVGVRRLDGGIFSTWATKELHLGDVVDVMTPVGDFTVPPPIGPRHIAAIAAGSGITPILSIASTVLSTEPDSRFSLIFGNRTAQSIMFLEELEGLKDRYTERFQMVHVLSREPSAVPLFSGRLDSQKIEALLDTVVTEPAAHWFLCGPYDMVHAAREVLERRQTGQVHDELFFAEPYVEPPVPPPSTEGLTNVTFTLDGRASVVLVDPAGPPILDYALGVRSELPFSCRGGVCATCKAKVVTGSVRMDENWCLVPEEVAAGIVLTCQSHPLTEQLVLDYDV